MPEQHKDTYIAFLLMIIITILVVIASAIFGFYEEITKWIVTVAVLLVFISLQIKKLKELLMKIANYLYTHKIKPWMLGTAYFVLIRLT